MKQQYKIPVAPQVKKDDYVITIGHNIIDQLEQFIQENYGEYQVVLITDENVYRDQYDNFCEQFGISIDHTIVISPGETSKSRQTKLKIDDELLAKQLTRKTIIIGFGGGVVGDLSGYIAATYKRGVPVIQVPTSLLSMVDSSVGGKTGINTRYGKNLIGAFWQPAAVYVDIEMLKTLPQEEFLNGFAECVKMSLILDAGLFEFMEKNIKAILNREAETVSFIIKRCVELKQSVVNQDTREKGVRQVLNFGHTIGHAMETLSNYEIKHGFGVSIGMAVELILSQKTGKLSNKDSQRIIMFLKKIDMPVAVPQHFSLTDIEKIMQSDKKAKQGIPYFVLLDAIGKYREIESAVSFSVETAIVRESITICKEKRVTC